MASGEVTRTSVDPGNLSVGSAITSSGRVSAARYPGDAPTTPPFTRNELIGLDEALVDATERSNVRFSVYIGDLEGDPVEAARKILPSVPEPSHAALIAVSPNTRDIAVVSGPEVATRVNDRVAQLGVTAAVSSFQSGDLIDGLIAALRVMSSAATRS